LSDIKWPPPSRESERRFEEREPSALLADRNGTVLYLLTLLDAETAMRAGQLLSLRCDNVNFHKRTAFLPDTKNGERRIVPLSSKALAVLNSMERTGGSIFAVSAS